MIGRLRHQAQSTLPQPTPTPHEPARAGDEPSDGADATGIRTDGLWDLLSASGVALAICGADGTVEVRNGALNDLAADSRSDAEDIFALLGDQNTFPKAWARLVRNGEPITRLDLNPATSAGGMRRVNVSAVLSSVWSSEPRVVVAVEDFGRRTAPTAGVGRLPRVASDRGDLLTALPNHAGVHDLVVDALRRAASTATSVSVLLCDVDHLGAINRDHGDAVGDQVLTMLAARISHSLRREDSLGRMGGGQFVVIAEGIDCTAQAESVATRVQVTAQEPMNIGELELRTTISIGYSIGVGFEQAGELMNEADSALIVAKASGPGHIRASAAITTAAHADPWRDQPVVANEAPPVAT